MKSRADLTSSPTASGTSVVPRRTRAPPPRRVRHSPDGGRRPTATSRSRSSTGSRSSPTSSASTTSGSRTRRTSAPRSFQTACSGSSSCSATGRAPQSARWRRSRCSRQARNRWCSRTASRSPPSAARARPANVRADLRHDLHGADERSNRTARRSLDLPTPLTGPPAGSPPGTGRAAGPSELLARGGVLVKGKPSAVAVGDQLLLIKNSWNSATSRPSIVAVAGLVTETEPQRPGQHADSPQRHRLAPRRRGRPGLPTAAPDAGEAPRHGSRGRVGDHGRHALARRDRASDAVGDPLLLELPGAGTGSSPGPGFDLARLGRYEELLWYANGPAGDPPTTPPSDRPPIPLMLARLTVSVHAGADLPDVRQRHDQVRYPGSGWTDVGRCSTRRRRNLPRCRRRSRSHGRPRCPQASRARRCRGFGG